MEKIQLSNLLNIYLAYLKESAKDLVMKDGYFSFNNSKGSHFAFILSSVFKFTNKHLIILENDRDSAAYLYNDIQSILGDNFVEFFPSSYQRSVQYGKSDSGNILLRTEVLNRIVLSEIPFIVVTYPEAFIEKVVNAAHIRNNSFVVKKGMSLSMDFFSDILCEFNFERTDFVYEPGQFAVRGSIIDVFSYSGEHPLRIDFFGDEISSIRAFNNETQLTIYFLDDFVLVPNLNQGGDTIEQISLVDFFPPNSQVAIRDFDFFITRLDEIINGVAKEENYDDVDFVDKRLLVTGIEFSEILKERPLIEFNSRPKFANRVIAFNTDSQPVLSKSFDNFYEIMLQFYDLGYSLKIVSHSDLFFERLQEHIDQQPHPLVWERIPELLSEGFIDHDRKLCVFTEHEFFGRYHKHKTKTGFAKKESITLKDLTDLHPGDYIVHIDHGIGKFGGLQSIEVNGKLQEAIRLVYRDNDVLFVTIHSLHRISKYKSQEGEPPKVHKLGSAVWQNQKNKAKSKVKDIARDLIKIYAERKAEKGYAFSADSFMNKQLESSFLYEDTPDQVKATRDVKKDMEDDTPMDRLVCGDVGFGKTEIAIRAAFKAASDSKQVAVLVPTTILALQHYKTFQNRLADFPVTVEYLSRLRKTSDQREVIKKLKEGKIDIIIGTHKLVGKNIEFKDLGLLVIDEEQKFGVSIKEKLREFKSTVDTLTLTATPIPRTLQFSLLGARDLSIINTPPPNRRPIQTEVHTFNETIIQEAVNFEIGRNGQVFFIHNRVQNISEIADLITNLCPIARVRFAHGQMDGPKLEEIMLDFIDAKFDVLVATTIIESGLDIPNANTIIINQAQNYGLSDLHQLRGRVGRSNRKAFAYLLAPPAATLSSEAKRRLKAIEDFSDLGSGFNIALQDLDIRGAGNLLGAEQSGFISDLGFEAYQKILNEALIELKQGEFSLKSKENSFDENENLISWENVPFVTDCTIDADFTLMLPEYYIANVSERINLYRRLDNLINEDELVNFEKELLDRFGPVPEESTELFKVIRLRWLAVSLGIEKIVLKNSVMMLYFVADSASHFYRSNIFSHILQTISNQSGDCRMQEKNGRLTLSYANVQTMDKAMNLLKSLSL